MKRDSYVDEKGNAIDQTFISKKPILRIFLFIGTIVPLIIIGFMAYKMFINYSCNKVYSAIKQSALKYVKDQNKVPTLEGERVIIDVKDLYSKKYLNKYYTNDKKCTGTVKITKYKNDFIYTLDIGNCESCSIKNKYGNWTKESSIYPKGKTVVDVIPYYNYYDRQINTTKWSNYFDEDELEDKVSKYGVKLPLDDKKMPQVSKEGKIIDVQKQEKISYRYRDKQWKWYDIIGDYSAFSSTQPTGFSNRDDSSKIVTEWSEYSQNYPEEYDYREIKSTVGYKYYYEKHGKKYYANDGDYCASDEVNKDKYDKHDSESVTIYRYRDYLWRWYNGPKRKYSSFSSKQPKGYNFRDESITNYTGYSTWGDTSTLTDLNKDYRVEEQKTSVRYSYIYEFYTNAKLKKTVTKKQFEKKLNMTTEDFSKLDSYKLEVTYKFRYRKSW